MRKDVIYDPCERTYICLDCGEIFDEPQMICETHYELDEKPCETFYVCPHCGEGDFEEARICEVCGEYMPESQSAYCLCAKCEAEAWGRFKKLMRDNFTPNERAYLYEKWEFEGDIDNAGA